MTSSPFTLDRVPPACTTYNFYDCLNISAPKYKVSIFSSSSLLRRSNIIITCRFTFSFPSAAIGRFLTCFLYNISTSHPRFSLSVPQREEGGKQQLGEEMDLIFPVESPRVPTKHFRVPDTLPAVTSAQNRDVSSAQGSPLTDPTVTSTVRQRIERGTAWLSRGGDVLAAGKVKDSAQRSALLQSALSILCHVAVTDKSQFFLYRETNSGKAANCSAMCGVDLNCSITDIYTTVRALKLEYDDALQDLKDVSGKHGADGVPLDSPLAGVEHRVDECLALLEPTLVALLLNFNRAKKAPASYITEMLQTLPQIFATQGWPCTILQRGSEGSSGRKHTRDNGHGGSSATQGSVTDDFREVANAATSVVYKTLRELESSDCLRLLNFKAAKPAPQVTERESKGVPNLDMLVRRTLGGVYRNYGLYSALCDVRLLFHGVYDGVNAEHLPLVRSLHNQFEEGIQRNYTALLRRTGICGKEEGAAFQIKTMFDVNPLPVVGDAAYDEKHTPHYTEVQRKCLKLLGHLRAVDREGWFEYPAFDLANIEFSSIERWVCGTHFGLKSNRGAFVALPDVLELMVNNCVMSYGPKNQFSRAITSVRPRLVDAAREVGLL
uniref:Uncharacterized protein TCIL3000_4_2160 n=1 Tax=Trypanosoma congolense (strain IL3000) TaxID=1068625 RepID=G0UL71_TRYCI|nr:unnamed protein product [Trypanosoma congolense IL3000]